jgi:hypothetical protein
MDLKRAGLLAAVGMIMLAATATAQLVPLERCHAAYPCSLPFGLRPADSLANNPYGSVGSTLIGVKSGLENGLKPKVVTWPVSQDPSEFAARIFVQKNPQLANSASAPTRTPTPRAP